MNSVESGRGPDLDDGQVSAAFQIADCQLQPRAVEAVRVYAALSPGELKDLSGVEILVELLNPEKETEWKGIGRALESFTGQEFGNDYNNWREWLKRRKEE